MIQHVLVDSNRVIFLNTRIILIMPEIYNLLFDKNSVIVFYKNNFSIYFVILVRD